MSSISRLLSAMATLSKASDGYLAADSCGDRIYTAEVNLDVAFGQVFKWAHRQRGEVVPWREEFLHTRQEQ